MHGGSRGMQGHAHRSRICRRVSWCLHVVELHVGDKVPIHPHMLAYLALLAAAVCRLITPMHACVQISDLPSRELVPGDVVELHVGDKVPADIRVMLLKTATVRAEQSSLTGVCLVPCAWCVGDGMAWALHGSMGRISAWCCPKQRL